jgi:DNA-binding MarR family transcriptional regulator
VNPNNPSLPNGSAVPNDPTERVLDAFDAFNARISRLHVPHVLELSLTLAQLKALYLIGALGPLRMSQVAEHLGTAPSTASGVVDGLVQLELLERLADPADRRQVVVRATPAALERLGDFRELGRSRLRELLARTEDASDLATIERAITLLTDAVGRMIEDTNT